MTQQADTDTALAAEATTPVIAPRRRWERAALVVLLLAQAVTVLVTTLRHEIWRDEAQAWLIACASNSPLELWTYLRDEGHPFLWYACLWVISRISDDPVLMQLFHAVLAVGTAAIVLFCSPLRLWQKALVVFGYLFIYEYAVVSRSYGLGVLLAVAVCALVARRERAMGWIGLLLFLLANTSVHGAILACGLGAGLAVDWLIRRRAGAPGLAPAWQVGLAALLCAGGLALSYAQIAQYPIDEPRFHKSYTPVEGAGEALKRFLPVSRSLWPLPARGSAPWGSHHLLVSQPNFVRFWFAMAGAAAMALAGLALLPKPAVWTTAAIAGGGLLGFGMFVYEGSPRHHGHYFVLFILALWLWHVYPTPAWPRWTLLPVLEGILRRLRPVGMMLLAAMLALHVYAGARNVLWDLRRTFSHAEAVANYLRANHPPGTFIMGFRDTPASSVAANLRRPVYYLESQSFGGPVNWRKRNAQVRDRDAVALAREALLSQGGEREGILLSQAELEPAHGVSMIEEARFGPGVEEFIVYRVRLVADE